MIRVFKSMVLSVKYVWLVGGQVQDGKQSIAALRLEAEEAAFEAAATQKLLSSEVRCGKGLLRGSSDFHL